MKLLIQTSSLCLLFAFLHIHLVSVVADSAAFETFVVSFQADGGWSTDQWLRYKNEIKNLDKEVTICHWEKIRYFSEAVNGVWAYCYTKSQRQKDIQCWQLYTATNRASSGRTMDVIVTTSSSSMVAEDVPYKHREWNHFCFTYSSITQIGCIYANGIRLKAEWQGEFNVIESGESVMQTSFIVGQEPDEFNGGYDSAQLFNGEISELNVWNTKLSEEDVKAMANCSKVIRGNIIPWEDNNFIFNEVEVNRNEKNSVFCAEDKKLFIFPERRSFEDAKTMCNVFGGQLVVPESAGEEEDILNVLRIHRSSCLDSSNSFQDDKAVWLGMERREQKWYVPNTANELAPILYTNWNSSYCTKEECGPADLSCPYLLKDGLWAFGLHWGTCSTTKLCTLCSFKEVPVFTLKGVCSPTANLDWNYYPIINDTHQIVGYDGYKTSNLTEKNGMWRFKDDEAIADAVCDHPIGRRDWSYKDNTCGMKAPIETSLTFSRCVLGHEFTCNSGQCIGMVKRCNQIKDCDDESDEEVCDMLHVPKSYNKIRAAVADTEKHSSRVKISTNINIISIDIIDTIHMQIGITFEMQIQWSDARLTFENLDVNGANLIPAEKAKNIWLPSEYIIHDNALLGNIIPDNRRELEIKNVTPASAGNIMKSIENFVHLGSTTHLVLTQRFKITYTCVFNVAKFPFDKHECHFIMKLKVKKGHPVIFMKGDPAIFYEGPNTVNQFEIENVTAITKNDVKSTNFIFSVQIRNNRMNQILGTFVPTSLLWSLAYFTLFIDLNDFSDRFIGSVTTLLVLVALLNAKNEELPKTSYFKYIDMWFLWYITSILTITLFHIYTNHITNEKKEPSQKLSQRAMVNRFAIVAFAAAAILFDLVYFYMTS